MGTSGLLPVVKAAIRPAHLKTFEGWTAAVDISIWICKGFYARGKVGMTSYVVSRFVALQEAKIKPVAVFDGSTPPCKMKTVEDRAAKRQKLNEPAEEEDDNSSNEDEFVAAFKGCVSTLQVKLTAIGIPTIIAPYEADSQLALLACEGYVNLIITEDSDLITLGCQTVLYKLGYDGMGDLYDIRMLSLCFPSDDFDFEFLKFMLMAFIMGTDYIKRVRGVGPSKAMKAVTTANSTKIEDVLKQIESILGDKVDIPTNYITLFHQNEFAFLHQAVFDPITKMQRPRIEYPSDASEDEKAYAGMPQNDASVINRALGAIPLEDAESIDGSFWGVNYQKPPPREVEEIVENGPPKIWIPPQCSFCGHLFQSQWHLKQHTMTHNGDRPWPCTFEGCAARFRQKAHMTTHLLTHTGEKPWPCTFEGCDSRFSLKQHMTTHLLTHTGDRPWPCTFEGCDATFRQQHHMQHHLLTHTGDRPWPCTFEGCDARFSQKGTMTTHLLTHTGDRPWPCTFEGCDARFRQQHHMQHHLLTHTGDRPWPCTFEGCEARFSLKQHMTTHLLTHTGGRPWACTFEGCDARFSQKGNMTTHLLTHTGDRPWACTYEGCKSRFSTKQNMETHLPTHTGEKPFACPFEGCKSSFNTKGNANRHYNGQHK